MKATVRMLTAAAIVAASLTLGACAHDKTSSTETTTTTETTSTAPASASTAMPPSTP